ncbi:hypothetical protein [Psychroserpens sp.]|uniref:hypothetical protein n=1 Tax=Psychroserpens sp. TaxID=2020870 RepID=UPI0039E2EF42
MANRIKIIFNLLKSGKITPIFNGITTRLYSCITSFGLEINPLDVSDNSLAENSLKVRRFKTEDLQVLKEEMRHIRLVKENIPTCYIVENSNQKPVFRQWVFKEDKNEQVKNYFGGLFPMLKKNEALLEGGFTHLDYRGQSIMAKAILSIFQLEENNDIKRYITFVDITNIASIKGLNKVGFKLYLLRKEEWFLFKRTISFFPITTEIEKSYISTISSKT